MQNGTRQSCIVCAHQAGSVEIPWRTIGMLQHMPDQKDSFSWHVFSFKIATCLDRHTANICDSVSVQQNKKQRTRVLRQGALTVVGR